MKVERSSVRVGLKVEVTITISEDEIFALDGIFGYNVDAFLKVFYEKMGKSYVQPHEAGVRSLHKTVRGVLAGPISEIKATRSKIYEAFKKE